MNRDDANTIPIEPVQHADLGAGSGKVLPYEVQEQRQQRLQQGKCPSCGQQLYRCTKRRSFFRLLRKEQKFPLTVPRLVERGQCLVCKEKRVRTPAAIPTAAAAASSSCVTRQTDHGSLSSFSSFIADDLGPGTAVYQGPMNSAGQKDTTGVHDEVGVLFWSNGDIYQGQFKCDQRHGHGTLEFGQGGEYVGDWCEGRMHGAGTRRFANGDVYTGPYRAGHREGDDGRFYYSNGDMYWGAWMNNQIHDANGRYYYASGQRFEGSFVSGKRNGKGKLQRKDGIVEIFQYVNDQRVGQGVRWSTDRSNAWRLWMPNARGGYRKQRISVAEAVTLVYEIEQAASSASEGLQ